MPHQCTTCGQQFDDGSKEMLSGCPNCGGNKFQFQPAGRGAGDDDPGTDTGAADTAEPAADTVDTADPVESADGVGTAETTDAADAVESANEEAVDDAQIADEVGAEDRAQRDARSSSTSAGEIDEGRRTTESSEAGSPGRGTPQGPRTETPSAVSADEFDVSGAVGPEEDEPVEKQPVAGSAPEHEEPDSDDADLGALREELNDQFESIKITAPGQYELNLMELYDRKEYIISLQEDGRYVIEMSESYGIDE